MALIVDIADAVVAELNDTAFSLPFTAVRAYRPVYELPEMSELHVTVVPRGVVISRSDRASHQQDYRVDVAVQKRLGAVEAVAMDPLMDLVEELCDHFKGLVLAAPDGLPAYRQASCVGIENEPVYAPEHLEEMRQFTSVITVTFRTWR